MRSKGLLVTIVVVIAALAIIIIGRSSVSGKAARKTAVTAKARVPAATATVPAARTFSKGMGGLTVRTQSSGGKAQYLRARAFSADGNNSSIFVVGFGTERMQELLPGTYDIEIDTIPVKIYKNINIAPGKETVKELGIVSGSINIKALNSKKKETTVLARVLFPRSNFVITSLTANRPAEMVPGAYNLEIDTLPRQTKNDVKVEAGKETVIDLGVISGSLVVKAADDSGKEARLSIRIKDPANNAVVVSTLTNRPVEIGPGLYDIEVLSDPVQMKKGVKVSAGEETAVDVTVKIETKAAAPKAAVPAKPKK